MEMMVVVMIIAILCAIGVPSLLSVRKTLKFKQMNDYAESIFMAAQTNLTKMKSEGRLKDLQNLENKEDSSVAAGNGVYELTKGLSGFPDEDWSADFRYTVTGTKAYDVILPGKSIDGTVRDKNILIEYNPKTGNVYSVFISGKEGTNIKSEYAATPGLPRDERERKSICLGYYQGSDIPTKEITQQETDTFISLKNGQEGIVTVGVVIPTDYLEKDDNGSKKTAFVQGLSVELTIEGQLTKQIRQQAAGPDVDLPEDKYSYVVPASELKSKGINNFNSDELKEIGIIAKDGLICAVFEYSIDSLRTGASFASHAYPAPVDTNGNKTPVLLTGIKNEDEMSILPGDNVDLTAKVSFQPPKGYQPVDVKNGTLSNVNPVFEYLTPSAENENEYMIGIKNGRNLQNLNILSPSIAKMVKSIHFTEEKLDWNETVSYYKITHADKSELPGRALPYFVPIYHKDLFGMADFQKNSLKNTNPEKDWPTIEGKSESKKGTEIYYLNIDAVNYNSTAAKFYATGEETLNYARYTGLFSYVNTRIDNLKIVNPVIKGFKASNQKDTKEWTATGALFGAGSEKTRVTNCAVYLDLKDKNFSENFMIQDPYAMYESQKWYGVSGFGAVGGLAGYCYNDKVVTGELDRSLEQMSFYKSFAAVPVSGEMSTRPSPLGFSFWEGVGGFIGNSMQANSFSCYASGNVKSVGGYMRAYRFNDTSDQEWEDDDEFLDDDYNVNGLNTSKLPADQLEGLSEKEIKELQEKAEQALKEDKKDIKNDDDKELELEDWAENRKDLPGFQDYKDWCDNEREGDDDIDDYWKDRFGYELKLSCDGGDSIGAGGFVGTCHGTRYSNCFAVGNVSRLPNEYGTSLTASETESSGGYESGAKEAKGLGTFVGIMCFDGIDTDKTNGKRQYSLFESCYALGFTLDTTKGKDDPGYDTELFSGGNGMWNLPFNTLFEESIRNNRIPMFITDYYRLLAPYYKSHNAVPQRGILYFFKDSYQYCRDESVYGADSSSNECASYLSGDNFVNLHQKHHIGNPIKADWIKERIETISQYNSGKYSTKYFGGNGINSPLGKLYEEKMNEGFNVAYWENANDSTTHPYHFNDEPKVYPYSKLAGMDYYGNWPVPPRDAGLAYYEIYEDGSKGIFYDRDGAAVGGLRNNKIVVKDGYAILSKTATEMSILKGQKYEKITPYKGVYRPQGSFNQAEFHVFPIPEKDLVMADPTQFYTELNMKDNNGKTFKAYYNPYMAMSQYNPADTKPGEPEDKPASLPNQILIRSARHFHMLSQMPSFWYSACHYYQQIDIDASVYYWNDFGFGKPGLACNPIGVAQNPFNGTYSSHAVDPAAVRGFKPAAKYADSGLFGVIGKTGTVKNLVIKADLTENTQISGNADNLGYLVGSNDGTLENITVDINTDGVTVTPGVAPEPEKDTTPKWNEDKSYKKGDVVRYKDGLKYRCIKNHKKDKEPDEDYLFWELVYEEPVPDPEPIIKIDKIGEVTLHLQADGNVGALAGKSTGLIENCTVSTENIGAHNEDVVNLSLSGKNVGVLAGYAVKNSENSAALIRNSNILLNDSLTLAGTNCGGVVGCAENTVFEVANLRLGNSQGDGSELSMAQFKSSGEMTGGFAGIISGGSADFATIEYTCAVNCDNTFGGFAAKASDLKSEEPTVLFNMNVEANTAAGLIADAERVNQSRPVVVISAPFKAKSYAAGMFGTISAGSLVESGNVDLLYGSIYSENGQAAGFAINSGATINRSNVFLAEDFYPETVKINGAEDAAGFAVSASGQMAYCGVSGMGEISSLSSVAVGDEFLLTGGQAAGFACELTGEGSATNCFVTPALNNDGSKYAGNSLANLKVTALKDASGFINNVETSSEFKSDAGVYNCWALGTVDGENSAGFVLNNQGKIEKCMANIAITGGHAFTAKNDGKVTACYGWYTDGAAAADATTVWGSGNKPVSSYFADVECNNGDTNVTVYDYDGNAETSSSTRMIYDKRVLEKLNKPDAPVTYWQKRGSFNAYPFDITLEDEYPYPMLRDHYGDWAEGPAHSFGVVYYEIYETSTGEEVYWIHSRDIYNGSNGLEDHKLDYRNFFKKVPDGSPEGFKIVPIGGPGDIGKPILVKQDGADVVVDDINGINLQGDPYNILPDKDIKKTGYAVFCKKTKSGIPVVPFEDSKLIYDETKNPACQPNEDLINVEVPNAAGDYAFYNLLKSGNLTIKDKDTGESLLQFNTWFGDTIDTAAKDKPYEIRSAEHFQNINLTANNKGTVLGNFKQTWDILNQNNNNPEFKPITSFNGVYDGNDRKIVVGSGNNSWIESIPTWKADHQGEDNADHEVVTGCPHFVIQNLTTAALIPNASQKIHIGSITLDQVDVPGGFAISNNASGGFECDEGITIKGDLNGSLFGSISGTGLKIADIYIGGRAYNDYNSANAAILCGGSGLKPMIIGKIRIGSLETTLFSSQINKPIEIRIQEIELGETTKTYSAWQYPVSIVNGPACDFYAPQPTVHPIDLYNPDGSVVLRKTTGEQASTLYPGNQSNLHIQSKKAFIQTLSAPLFDNLNSCSLENLDIQIGKANLTAEEGSSIGILADTMTASVVDNCNIEVGQVNVSGNGTFGTLVGEANGNTDIKNTTVKANIVRTAADSAAVNGEAAPAVIGGIAGKNKDSSISNCTVEGLNMTLPGAKDVNTTAGGLVGVNEGNLSGNTVKDASITYVQPAVSGDTAQIGGLVGQMNGGSMENDTVSGKILIEKAAAEEGNPDAGIMTADLMMRDYSIGGAVGAESTETLKKAEPGIATTEEAAPADYTGVTSDVVIANEWTDPAYVAPEDLSSVGMFVGYVEDGIFDTCSSTVEDNQKYSFLGDIRVDSKTTPVDALAQDASNAGNMLSLEEENLEESLTAAGKKNYKEYAAVLIGCTFHKNGEDFQQTIETSEFFYQKKEAKANQPKDLIPVSAAITQKDNLLLKDLAAADTEGAFVPSFFYGTAEDGTLQRLAVLLMVSDDVYTYELAFMDGTSYDVMEVSGAELDTAVWNSLPVFTFTHNLTDGAKYLIMDIEDQMLAVSGDGELVWEPKAESLDKITERMLWTASRKTVDSVSWQNVSNTAYFLSDDLTALAGDHALQFQIGQDSSIHLGTCEKALKLTQVNVEAIQAETGYESIGSSQTLLTQKLDENGDPIIETETTEAATTETTEAATTETTEAATTETTEAAATETTEATATETTEANITETSETVASETTTETSAATQAAEASGNNEPTVEKTVTDSADNGSAVASGTPAVDPAA